MSKPLKIITVEDQMRRINAKINPLDEGVAKRIERAYDDAGVGYVKIDEQIFAIAVDPATPYKGIARSGHYSSRAISGRRRISTSTSPKTCRTLTRKP